MEKIKASDRLVCFFELLLALLLVLNMVTALLSLLGLKEQLGWMPYAALSVQGGSMEPVLSEGDLIVIREVPYGELRVGDDVTFRDQDGLVTHRIVAVRDGKFITHGLANETDDLYALEPAVYCGRVVIVLPYLGHVLQVFGDAQILLYLMVAAILLVCLIGVRRCRTISRTEDGAAPRQLSPGAIRRRALAGLCALCLLISSPELTGAKYVGLVNRFDVAVAHPLYFSSNYLSEGEGNMYSIQGWNGQAYPLSLQIRNYDNALLFNTENTTVTYGFGIKIYTEAGDGVTSSDYTLSITPAGQTPAVPLAAGQFTYPSDWGTDAGQIRPVAAYQIEGGQKSAQTFNVVVTPNAVAGEETPALAANSKIRFEVYAVTEQGKTYDLQLKGAFRMQVAQAYEFIGMKTVENLPSMVNMSVTTNVINDGSDEKVVLFQWDPTKVYLNEYESTAFNVITNNPGYFFKSQGRLYMRLQPYSKINLEFFKMVSFEAGNEDILVQVVSQVGAEPTLPAEPTPEQGTN